MSNVYFSSGYIPKKRTFQRKEINQQEETKESIIRDIENNRRLKLKQQYYSTSSNNLYKTGFLVMCGALVVACIWGVYTIGYKSGKRKYKYKKCKY